VAATIGVVAVGAVLVRTRLPRILRAVAEVRSV
jgi:hypothetical protein